MGNGLDHATVHNPFPTHRGWNGAYFVSPDSGFGGQMFKSTYFHPATLPSEKIPEFAGKPYFYNMGWGVWSRKRGCFHFTCSGSCLIKELSKLLIWAWSFVKSKSYRSWKGAFSLTESVGINSLWQTLKRKLVYSQTIGRLAVRWWTYCKTNLRTHKSFDYRKKFGFNRVSHNSAYMYIPVVTV